MYIYIYLIAYISVYVYVLLIYTYISIYYTRTIHLSLSISCSASAQLSHFSPISAYYGHCNKAVHLYAHHIDIDCSVCIYIYMAINYAYQSTSIV